MYFHHQAVSSPFFPPLAVDLVFSIHFCHQSPFYHQFPDLLGSAASVKLTLGARRDPKLLLLFLGVGLRDRTVEGDQLGVNFAAAK